MLLNLNKGRTQLSQGKELYHKYFEEISFEKRVWVPSAKVSNYMIMFTKCGIGDESDMGRGSFRDMIITLSESEMVPRVLAFWNNSVVACVENSKLLPALTKLEGAGVKILVAGHALNALNLKKSLRVGRLANHFDLVAVINKVQKVVTF